MFTALRALMWSRSLRPGLIASLERGRFLDCSHVGVGLPIAAAALLPVPARASVSAHVPDAPIFVVTIAPRVPTQ